MKFLFSVLFLVSINCIAQKFDWKSREVKSDTDLLKAVVYIGANTIPVIDNHWGNGTAFFFYSIAKSKLYLITNKHAIYGQDTLNFTVKKINASLKDSFTIFPISDLK